MAAEESASPTRSRRSESPPQYSPCRPINSETPPRLGLRAARPILLTASDELAGERTRAVNALTALLLIDLGLDVRRPLGARRVAAVARWRTREEHFAAATEAPWV